MITETEQYIMILRQSCDTQAAYIKEMRGLRHDMQAHMVVLQFYLEEGKYDKAKEYLREMREHQERIKGMPVDTGNSMINAVLAERLQRTKADIRISCVGEIPKSVEISEYDLCTIFSNLFSNAVEACEKLQEREKVIAIAITREKSGWCISIQNPLEWMVDAADFGANTSKEDKESHGFGLRNVKTAVQRNGGRMEFVVADSSIAVRVYLLCK